jgi:hypothetical protein
MAEDEAVQQALRDDLSRLAGELADDQSAADLYRALANNVWLKEGAGGKVSLSWKEAERLVNDLRAQGGREPLELVQSGGEGTVAKTVEQRLAARNWRHQPLDTSAHEPGHGQADESPPPPDHGERLSPDSGSGEWERTAHEEADRAKTAVDSPAATHGTGAGGGRIPRTGG